MHRIVRVEVLKDYRLDLAFDDRKRGIVDLSPLAGKGVFSIWSDYDVFGSVRVGESGELLWSDRIDLCPDALYLQATHQRAEDVFPALKRDMAYA